MARPLRLEFAGALYHVTERGDGREDIYRADDDRREFLDVLGGVWQRFNWTMHAYCLMSNHYHLLVETPDANLSKGMRQLNGVYTQRFNRTYDRVGHVSRCFGRSLLSADKFELKPGVLTCENTVHLAGSPLKINAFPFSGQDAKLDTNARRFKLFATAADYL